MLQANSTSSLQRDDVHTASKSPITDFIRNSKGLKNSQRSRAESRSKQGPAPIIQTRVPQAFKQVYVAANRGEAIKDVPPATVPARRLSRTRSCLSTRSSSITKEEPTVRQTTRTVSFGSFEGKIVENIARENKNLLWFSKDEYSAMRHEAILIATTTKRLGAPRESSQISTRGLEQYIKDDSKSEFAKKSILEHNDLAMYALASARAVNTARSRAEMDAIEVHSFQSKNKPKSQHKLGEKQISKRKLLNP